MNPFLFREYDIRGHADRDLNDRFVLACADALGTYFRQKHPHRDRLCLSIGRDCRLHSPRIHKALVNGLLCAGIDIIDIGIAPTPLLYFSTHHLGVDGGIQITGSHNPTTDNGFKIVEGTQALHGQALQQLRRMIDENQILPPVRQGIKTFASLEEAYLSFAISRLHMGPRRCKIVVDAGNGTGGPLLVSLLRSLGYNVIPLFCEMDGRFPNHHPDPSVEENMQALRRRVLDEGAELGLALDGDADRLGAVDGTGRIVFGEDLLILLSKSVLEEQPGATIVAEVKCSQVVYDEIRKAGGTAVMWKVGHSVLKQKMRELGAALAGEMSGHLFFAHRYLGYDDAIYAAARLVEFLSKRGKPFSSYIDDIPKKFSTKEIRKNIDDSHKFELVGRVTAHFQNQPGAHVINIDGARIQFEGGWALVRASNTQAKIGMRFEADTKEQLAIIEHTVLAAVHRAEAEVCRGILHHP